MRETVAEDIASIVKFQPPDGRLVLAFSDGHACGIGCLRRIGADTAEIKRMDVDPTVRRGGARRPILECLLIAATSAGYLRARLDSPRFMTAAHALYRSSGFVDIEPYAESAIPDMYKPFLIFMQRDLRPASSSAERLPRTSWRVVSCGSHLPDGM